MRVVGMCLHKQRLVYRSQSVKKTTQSSHRDYCHRADQITNMEHKHPASLLSVHGDFNRANLTTNFQNTDSKWSVLPGIKTLDHCCKVIKDLFCFVSHADLECVMYVCINMRPGWSQVDISESVSSHSTCVSTYLVSQVTTLDRISLPRSICEYFLFFYFILFYYSVNKMLSSFIHLM